MALDIPPMPVKAKMIVGAFWLGVLSISTQLLTFLTSVILARILVPEDFGLIAMAMIVINGLKIVYDFGLAQALIYFKDDTNSIASTLFYLIVLSGAILYLIVVLLAPAFASFYNAPTLIPLLRVLALILPLSSLWQVPGTLLEKRMEFRQVAFIEMASILAYTVASITLAAVGSGVWSIVWGRIAQNHHQRCFGLVCV